MKDNYENYISRVMKTIVTWQDNDITYLNSVYPDMEQLFYKTAEIDDSIFARSQNDNDFMRLSLGKSAEVKPLFEIKAEKKIIYSMTFFIKQRENLMEI